MDPRIPSLFLIVWVPIFILREEALCGEGWPESRGGLQGEPSPSESEQGLGEATGNLSDQNKSKNFSSSVKGVSGAPLSLSPPPPPFFPFLVPTAVERKKKKKRYPFSCSCLLRK